MDDRQEIMRKKIKERFYKLTKSVRSWSNDGD